MPGLWHDDVMVLFCQRQLAGEHEYQRGWLFAGITLRRNDRACSSSGSLRTLALTPCPDLADDSRRGRPSRNTGGLDHPFAVISEFPAEHLIATDCLPHVCLFHLTLRES